MKNLKKIILTLLCVALTLSFAACGDPVVALESVVIDGNAAVTVTAGETKTFTASVKPDNATDKSITWSLKAGATATGAAINQSGEFSAGSVAGTAVVRAESAADSSKYAEVTVTVQAAEEEPDDEEHVVITAVTLSGTKERVIAIGGATSFAYTSDPADAAATNFVWSVVDSDLAEGTDFTFIGGVLTSVSANSGFVRIKIAAVNDAAKYDIAVVNINYAAVTYHTVTFYTDDTKTVIVDVQSVAAGSAASEPGYAVVGKEVTWDVAFDNVTGNLDVCAQLTEIEYTISYYAYDNTADDYIVIDVFGEGTEQTVAFGGSAVLPDPAQYARDGYEFINWRIEKTGNIFRLYAEYAALPAPPAAE